MDEKTEEVPTLRRGYEKSLGVCEDSLLEGVECHTRAVAQFKSTS